MNAKSESKSTVLVVFTAKSRLWLHCWPLKEQLGKNGNLDLNIHRLDSNCMLFRGRSIDNSRWCWKEWYGTPWSFCLSILLNKKEVGVMFKKKKKNKLITINAPYDRASCWSNSSFSSPLRRGAELDTRVAHAHNPRPITLSTVPWRLFGTSGGIV
jgi:hypothetical protein